MDNNEEKLRLLFVEQEKAPKSDEGQAASISQGAVKIFEKWPSYVTTAMWCIVFIVCFATLLLLTILASLIYEGTVIQKIFVPKKSVIKNQEIQSEFCSQMIAKHNKKRQEIPQKDLKLFDSGKSMFYLVTTPLNKFSSCSVETVIQHSPEKNIFMIFLQQVPKFELEFENALKVKYSNFNLLHIDGRKVLKGSPFEGDWNGDERSLFEVALLSVWQFGGTVLSEYLFMLNNRFFESPSPSPSVDCKVDPELIYCPEQCAAFLYDFIGVALHSPRDADMGTLLDGSIKEFCGSEKLVKIGCPGVKRVDEGEVCEEPAETCSFVRTRKWLQESGNESLWQNVKKHCPITRGHQAALDRQERMKDTSNTTKKFSETKTTKACNPFTISTTQCQYKNNRDLKKSAFVKSIYRI